MEDLFAGGLWTILFSGGLAVVQWVMGRFFGGLASLLWSYLYGPERTATARLWVVVVPFAVTGVVFLAGLGAAQPDPLPGPVELWWTSVSMAANALGVWQAMRPIDAGSAVEPGNLERDHDGIRMELVRRATWPAALFFGFGPAALPLGLLLALLWRSVPTPRTSVRVRYDVVEVGTGEARALIPLAGLRITRRVRWDGTPLVTLHGADGQERTIVVGGHPPGEVAWLVQTLEGTARSAPEVQPVASPPAALRAMVERTRT